MADTISAISVLIASIAAAVASIIAALRAGNVHKEVKTMNELTLGQLGERQETRRIEDIPMEDRSAQETRHVTPLRKDDPDE
jgi:hypothetical protein